MTNPKETYHPEFNDPEGDLVIECKDGVKFKVHSYILKAHRYVVYQWRDHLLMRQRVFSGYARLC